MLSYCGVIRQGLELLDFIYFSILEEFSQKVKLNAVVVFFVTEKKVYQNDRCFLKSRGNFTHSTRVVCSNVCLKREDRK